MSCQCGCGRLLHMVLDGRGLPRPWELGDPTTLPRIRLHYWPHVNADRPWCAVINYGMRKSVIGNLWPTPAEALKRAWDMM